jgi:predicted dehydrogenase
MVKAARKYKRVVQVGTQQRSGPHYQTARNLIRGGELGTVHAASFTTFRNIYPGFPETPVEDPPKDLDYELWVGPAPKRPYTRFHTFYHWRWFWDYSGGQMVNLGSHEVDIVHWFMGFKGPRAVTSSGGRLCLKSGGETPDTQDTVWEYPSFVFDYQLREACTGRRGGGGGFTFFGTKGSMTIGRGGFQVYPETKIDPRNGVPGVINGWAAVPQHPAGGPRRTDVKDEPWMQEMKGAGSQQEQFDLHARNFLDCIKSRQRPIADIEDGHQVATATHLANLSLRLGRKLRWDAEKEEVIGDREASQMLVRPYRRPWDDALKSLNL